MNKYVQRFRLDVNKLLLENEQKVIKLINNPYIINAFEELLKTCEHAVKIMNKYLISNTYYNPKYVTTNNRKNKYIKDKDYQYYRNMILEMVNELSKYEYNENCEPIEHYDNCTLYKDYSGQYRSKRDSDIESKQLEKINNGIKLFKNIYPNLPVYLRDENGYKTLLKKNEINELPEMKSFRYPSRNWNKHLGFNNE